MKAIYKYVIPTQYRVSVEMPIDNEILDVQFQGNYPCIWALVDPDAKKEMRNFRVFGTGHPIEDPENLNYIGTYQIPDRKLVFHLFEVN